MTHTPPDQQIPLVQLADVENDARRPLPSGQADAGRRITLHFSLALEDGQVIDSCFDREPASFVFGDGSMLPGFEQQLQGRQAGEEIEVLIPAEQAFGLRQQENIQSFPRFRFPPDLQISEGLMIDFADAAGNTQAGVILSADSENVSVDFNHPLAGRNIVFRAHIHQVNEV